MAMVAEALIGGKLPLSGGNVLAEASEQWPELGQPRASEGQFDDAPDEEGEGHISAASRELYAGLSTLNNGAAGEKKGEDMSEEEDEENDEGEEEVLEALDWVDLREGRRRCRMR
jgi:hypothetical protein